LGWEGEQPRLFVRVSFCDGGKISTHDKLTAFYDVKEFLHRGSYFKDWSSNGSLTFRNYGIYVICIDDRPTLRDLLVTKTRRWLLLSEV
jgi:hypothetical protein